MARGPMMMMPPQRGQGYVGQPMLPMSVLPGQQMVMPQGGNQGGMSPMLGSGGSGMGGVGPAGASKAPPPKREKKPLLIVDPKTNQAVLPATLPPASAPASPAATPKLTSQKPPVALVSTPQLAPPAPTMPPIAAGESAAGMEMVARARELMGKGKVTSNQAPQGAVDSSAAPSMDNVVQKMETLKLDEMPQVRLPGPSSGAVVAAQKKAVPAVTAAVPPTVAAPPIKPSFASAAASSAKFDEVKEKQENAKKRAEEAKMKLQRLDEEQAKKRKEAEEKASIVSLPVPPASAVMSRSDSTASAGGKSNGPAATVAGERRVYSKFDMLMLRDSPASRNIPDNWPEEFLTARMHGQRQFGGDVAAQAKRAALGQTGPPRINAIANQGGNSEWRGVAQPEVLRRGENAWKRTKTTGEHEASLRKIRGIVNRLTRENFTRLSKQVLEIPMLSLTLLQDVIKEIFDKALKEPNFGSVYADLCRDISEKSGKGGGEWDFVTVVPKEIPSGGTLWFWASAKDLTQDNVLNGPDLANPDVGFATEHEASEAARKFTAFKRLLLNTCQEEFEKNSFAKVDAEEERVRREEDLNLDATKMKLNELEAERRSTKRRVLGNISFIGELFLKKMISAKIINTCVYDLLGEDAFTNPESFFQADRTVEMEDVECLCKLFQTIGKDFDSGVNVTWMDKYFKFLELTTKSKKVDARHRFMCLNIIELRKMGWVERRETLKASTKEEVREYAARQEQEQATRAHAAGPGPSARGSSGPASGRGSGGPPVRGGSTVRGGAVGRVPVTSSRFAQGATTNQDVRMAGIPKVNVPPPTTGGAVVPRPKVDFPPVTVSAPAVANTPVVDGEPISLEKLKTSLNTSFDEFLQSNNVADLLDDVKAGVARSSDNQAARRLFVEIALSRILEKKDQERNILSGFLTTTAFENKLFESSDLIAKLSDTVEFLQDLIIDIPKADVYMSTFVALCVSNKVLSPNQISEALRAMNAVVEPQFAKKFADEVSKKVSDGPLAQTLASVLNGGGGSAQSGSGEDWVSMFTQMVRERKSQNELLQVASKVPSEQVAQSGPELVEVIFQTAGDASEKETVSANVDVLKRLLQNGPDQVSCQAKALACLASFAASRAEGFLARAFEALYRNEIVLEEAFQKWKEMAKVEDAGKCSVFFDYLQSAQVESNDD